MKHTTLLAVCVTAFASSAHAIDCQAIQARLIATPFSADCRSPIGYCTAGTIEGDHGLAGTTAFTADSAAPGPATALHAAATNAYSGLLQITTAQGGLSLRDAGLADVSPGSEEPAGFSSSYAVVTGGSGRYAGATGHFFIAGRTAGGRFASVVMTGKLCLP